jgi:hypothetical protein
MSAKPVLGDGIGPLSQWTTYSFVCLLCLSKAVKVRKIEAVNSSILNNSQVFFSQ